MKDRRPYEKPAVIFEKGLEAMAGVCDPAGNTIYMGTELNHCKAEAACVFVAS